MLRHPKQIVVVVIRSAARNPLKQCALGVVVEQAPTTARTLVLTVVLPLLLPVTGVAVGILGVLATIQTRAAHEPQWGGFRARKSVFD